MIRRSTVDSTPIELPRWGESAEFRGLLAAFDSMLPLKKPSGLSQRPIVQFLVVASRGLLAEVSRMLGDGAKAAMRDGTENITLAHLEDAARVRR